MDRHRVGDPGAPVVVEHEAVFSLGFEDFRATKRSDFVRPCGF